MEKESQDERFRVSANRNEKNNNYRVIKSNVALTDGQHRTPREDVEWHGLVVL